MTDDLASILDRLRSDDDRTVTAAAKDLLRAATPAWSARLAEVLATDADPDVRDAAAAACAQVSGADAIPALVRACRAARDAGDEDDAILAAAVSLVESKPSASEPVLAGMLESPDSDDRRAAAHLWGCADLPVGPLAARRRDEAAAVRTAVAGSLAAFAPDADACAAVVELSRDEDESVRVAAALALAAFPARASGPRLRELASDPSPRVRGVAGFRPFTSPGRSSRD